MRECPRRKIIWALGSNPNMLLNPDSPLTNVKTLTNWSHQTLHKLKNGNDSIRYSRKSVSQNGRKASRRIVISSQIRLAFVINIVVFPIISLHFVVNLITFKIVRLCIKFHLRIESSSSCQHRNTDCALNFAVLSQRSWFASSIQQLKVSIYGFNQPHF